MINRDTKIPVKETKHYTTCEDYQTKVDIDVFEGENKIAKDNSLLGSFTLSDLPRKLKGEMDIEVTFAINFDGILNVTALERSTNKQESIKIIHNKRNLTEEEIQWCINFAKTLDSSDVEKIELVLAKNNLLALSYQVMSLFNEGLESTIPENELKSNINKVESTIAWLNTAEELKLDNIQKRIKEIEDIQASFKLNK